MYLGSEEKSLKVPALRDKIRMLYLCTELLYVTQEAGHGATVKEKE
jgi:hypothetical protein